MNLDEKDAAKVLKSRMNLVLSELILAEEALTIAKAQLEAARMEEMNAVNVMNRLQKDFDTLVEEVKKFPGEGTDWFKAARAR